MVNIPKKQLGRNGPMVSSLGFGAMGLSVAYGPGVSYEEAWKVLDAVVAHGINHIDTSTNYGDSEDMIGQWFERNPENRSKVFLATKFGVVRTATDVVVRGDREFVKQACYKSLERLKTDKIDIFYAHRIDKNTPIEETMEAFVELINEGKIDYIGLSECSSDTLRRACAVHQVQAVQVEYSPFAVDIESDQIGLLKTARELGVAIVPYSPLGRGMLTGQLKSPDDFRPDDFRAYAPRFSKENFPKNLVLVDQISEIGKSKGCTPGQLTLAWVMAQGDDFFPIPGTKKIKYLDENAGACGVSLTKEEVAEIRKGIEAIETSGDRYPEGMATALYGDSAPKRA